jgi:hypothetical protein
VGEEAETTATTVAEPKKDVLPLVFSGLALAGTVGLGLFTLFKKPAEATSTAGKVVDEVAQREIKELRETIATQAQELAEKAKKLTEKATEILEQQIQSLTSKINELELKQGNPTKLSQQETDIIDYHRRTLERLEKELNALEREAYRSSTIGVDLIVNPAMKALFKVPLPMYDIWEKPYQYKAGENNTSKLKELVDAFGFEGREGTRKEKDPVKVLDLITEAFNHLQNNGKSGHPSEMKKLKHALMVEDKKVVDPYKKELKALVKALDTIDKVYNGVSLDGRDSLYSYPIVSSKELVEKANGVLNVAKTNDVEKTKTAQAELMTWLEGIFTKTRLDHFNENTKGKTPITLVKELAENEMLSIPPPALPLEVLTARILGRDANAVVDVTTLADDIYALREALVEEQGYTLEKGRLEPSTDDCNNYLASIVNYIASTLVPITEETIEGGDVPLGVIAGDTEKLSLYTQLWNARLNGDKEGVKTVTAQMFEYLQQELLNGSVSDFMVKHPLTFPITDNYGEGVNDFLSQKCGIISVVAPKVDEMITNRGEDLPQGTDFVQTVINQFFEAMESYAKRKTGIDTYPQTLYNFYEKTFDKLILNGGDSENVQQWRDSSFAQVLKYSARVSDSGVILFTYEADKMSQLINWQHFPDLKEKVQAVITARTESVQAVKAKQTELMAFLQKHFYKKPTEA